MNVSVNRNLQRNGERMVPATSLFTYLLKGVILKSQRLCCTNTIKSPNYKSVSLIIVI
jgi:hypothetical protein